MFSVLADPAPPELSDNDRYQSRRDDCVDSGAGFAPENARMDEDQALEIPLDLRKYSTYMFFNVIQRHIKCVTMIGNPAHVSPPGSCHSFEGVFAMKRLVIVFTLSLAIAIPAFAQTRGQHHRHGSGRAGRSCPVRTVTAKGTDATYHVTSPTHEGMYHFLELAPGSYKVTLEPRTLLRHPEP